jgi:hypothetical protein
LEPAEKLDLVLLVGAGAQDQELLGDAVVLWPLLLRRRRQGGLGSARPAPVAPRQTGRSGGALKRGEAEALLALPQA